MAGQQPLELRIGVRIPVPEHIILRCLYKYGIIYLLMDKKELEEILDKHAKRTDKKLGELAKNTDCKLEVIADDVSTIKENVSNLTDKVSHLTDKVGHLTKNVSNLTEKVDVIFEQTGKLTVDMEVVRGSVERHEQKIKQL